MNYKGIKKKECKLCPRLIPEKFEYCEIHRHPKVIKMHEDMRARLKENKGKGCYADYLAVEARKK